MTAESLIFDIDGTLWDSRALVAEGYNIQLTRENLTHLFVTVDDLTPLFGKVMTEISDTLFASIPKPDRYELFQRCTDTETAHLLESTKYIGYPKVKETLEKLAKKYRLFIVSNCQKGYPEACIEKLGLGELIQGHLCFGDTGTNKAGTIRRLMEQHNIESAVYIGDTQGDLEASEGAGIPFVFCTFGFGSPDHWDAKLEKFEDLTTLFL